MQKADGPPKEDTFEKEYPARSVGPNSDKHNDARRAS
jgi:hypothetical protein